MFPIRHIIFFDRFVIAMDESQETIPWIWSKAHWLVRERGRIQGCARGETGSPATLENYCDMFRWSSEYTNTPLDRGHQSVACHYLGYERHAEACCSGVPQNGQKKRVHQCGISENTVFQNNTEPHNTRDQADRLTLSDTLAKLVAFAGKTREIGPSRIIPKNLTWKS